VPFESEQSGSWTQHVVCTPKARGQHGQIRQIGVKDREVGNASPEEGNTEEWFRPAREEPEAGDCHRAQRGEEEGRQGACTSAQIVAKAVRRAEEEVLKKVKSDRE
jgi:hypothetical protein